MKHWFQTGQLLVIILIVGFYPSIIVTLTSIYSNGKAIEKHYQIWKDFIGCIAHLLFLVWLSENIILQKDE